MSTDEKSIAEIIRFYQNDELLKYELEGFKKQVENFFLDWPDFVVNQKSVIHSIKSRIKDPQHLRDKIYRKTENGRKISIDIFENKLQI